MNLAIEESIFKFPSIQNFLDPILIMCYLGIIAFLALSGIEILFRDKIIKYEEEYGLLKGYIGICILTIYML